MKRILEKSRVRLTIRNKLIFSFIIILLIPSILIGFLAYQSAKKELSAQLIGSASSNVDVLNSMIDDTIQPKIHDIEFFSSQINSELYDGMESPEIRQKLEQYTNLHPELELAYVGNEEGLMIQSPDLELADDYDPRERPWYQQAKEKAGQVVITEPYVSSSTNTLVVTIARTTEDNSGVIGMDITLGNLEETSKKIHIGKEGYTSILDQTKHIIVHPTEEKGSEATADYLVRQFEEENGKYRFEQGADTQELVYTTNKLTGWKVAGVMSASEIDEAAAPILYTMLIVLAAALIAGGFLVFGVVRSIIKPLNKLKQTAVQVSGGDLRERIEIYSKDELAEVGEAFNTMTDNLSSLIKQIDTDSGQLAASSEELLASSEQTTSATEHVTTTLQEVAEGSDSQRIHVEQNAQAIGEIAIGMDRVANSLSTVSDSTKQAASLAADGEHSVNQTVEQMKHIYASVNESNARMQELETSSKKIGSITDVIVGIADQTNLLALNAAIEAARAGEQGKGFAVVADEVRKLAEESQRSAMQITDLIQHIQSDTVQSVKVMAQTARYVETGLQATDETTTKFSQIKDSIFTISPQIEDISSITEQIAASVQEMTASAEELAAIAKENAAASETMASTTEEQLASMEEITASANALSNLAEELQELLTKFKL
ncbi:methyl-accepting chemotaxis protein [Terribacillus saccharophilus]|uniref:methyl-accepting chemotaxis protein n=1 Tax=Terribacillus saccharophilus TaxID=361277 RepID=UPI002989E8D6|nr:methyl-accepting chemotaxis protein [Terribacillus saccharophilus]MCM3225679.1 methyl-accepting chemotaxis protein [Terribacillus saccharophilus]